MNRRSVAACAGMVLALGCGSTSKSPHAGEPLGDGAGGAAGAPHVGGASNENPCRPPAPALVRLAYPELIQSARVLFDDELADAMLDAIELRDRDSSFPPLASSREGDTIDDARFAASDTLAQLAGAHVRDHFDLTGCQDEDYDCVRDYVANLAERAFRKPLSPDERDAVLLTVERAEALGVSAIFGAEYGVYAVFESPLFLYRTELGAPAAELAEGELRLTDHELASALSFFLTGGPPDQGLLDAADAGTLTGAGELEEQVDRLLAMPSSRQHLERALASYFGFQELETVVIDPAIYPLFSPALARAMRSELDDLLARTLWSGQVGDLLTTRDARLNGDLAKLYGVAFPPVGSEPDASGFADVTFGESRAGLLTRAGWLTRGSRPEGPSVVERGFEIATHLLCRELPSVDTTLQLPAAPPELNQRGQAEFRMSTPECRECHREADPFGLAVDELDGIGQFRSKDWLGRAIDANVTLPAFAGGAQVKGAVGLSRALSAETFATCLSQRFLSYALTIPGRSNDICERNALARERATTGDLSFRGILRQVALSRTFRLRK